MHSLRKKIPLFVVLLGLGLMSNAYAEEEASALESYNRAMFKFNTVVDHYTFRAMAKVYGKLFSKGIRNRVHNFFSNLEDINVAVNGALQGKFKQAGMDSARFLVNTTVGLAGLIDVGSRIGLEKHNEDFGQTLGVWGMAPGPYIVLPVLGPSTLRDAPGRFLDGLLHPRRYVTPAHDKWALTVVDLVDRREEYLDKEQLLVGDRYLFVREAYLQRRDYLTEDGLSDGAFIDDDWDDDEWE